MYKNLSLTLFALSFFTLSALAGLPAAMEARISGNDLIIEDTGGQNDTLTVERSGAVLHIANVDSSSPFPVTLPISAGAGVSGNPDGSVTVALSNFSGIVRCDLNAGDDTLNLDFSGGYFDRSIEYNGGTQQVLGDRLEIQTTLGSSSAPPAAVTMTHIFLNANDGSITDSAGLVINYTGLEPIVDNLNALNRVFQFMGGSETVTLKDDANPLNNLSFIDSTLGESVTFLNPTDSLSVSVIPGGGADTFILNPLDSNFNADLNLGGDSNDLLQVTVNSVSLINGDLSVLGFGRTELSVNVSTTGNQTYEGPLFIEENVSLRASNVVVESTLDSGSSERDLIVVGHFQFGNGDGDRSGSLNKLKSLTVTGEATLNGTGAIDIDTNGPQHYQSNLILAADTFVRGKTQLRFDGSVNGAYQFQFQSSIGTVLLNGPVGDVTPPTIIQDQSNGDRVFIQGGLLRSSGSVSLSPIFVRVDGPTNLTQIIAESGNITLGSSSRDIMPVKDAVEELQLISSALTSIGGNMGEATNRFESVHMDAAGTASLGTVEIHSSGVLDFQNALTLNGDVELSPGAASLIDAEITGAGSLRQNGPGLLTLNASNSYTGVTTVKSAALEVNGSLVSSNVTVNADGTLFGDGILYGAVEINNAVLLPGSAVGRLTVGSVKFMGGVFSVEIQGPDAGSSYDQLRASAVDLGNVNFNRSVIYNGGTQFVIIDNIGSNAVVGTFQGLPEGATFTGFGSLGKLVTVTYMGGDGNDVVLDFGPPIEFTQIEKTTNGVYELEWVSQSNEFYKVRYANSPGGEFTNATGSVGSAGALTQWADDGSQTTPGPDDVSNRVYRVRITNP